ncbi:phage baseplate plug family protein [Calorimonas adulescens]|nr:hypothetical protein [Calorimonas adulescens]
MMQYITPPDLNDSFSRVVLGGKEYLLRFTYNDTFGYWSFGIYDLEETPIVAMTKIVPNSPLTFFYENRDLPSGVFGVITDLEKVGRNDFINGKAVFVFIPYEDLKE